MFRLGLTILLLLTLCVRTLPLRLCAVQEAFVGHSCHDGDIARTNSVDGHAPSNGQHDPDCLCEMPKGEVDRNVSATVLAFDLLPCSFVPLQATLTCHASAFVHAAEQPPDLAPAAVTLPLLI